MWAGSNHFFFLNRLKSILLPCYKPMKKQNKIFEKSFLPCEPMRQQNNFLTSSNIFFLPWTGSNFLFCWHGVKWCELTQHDQINVNIFITGINNFFCHVNQWGKKNESVQISFFFAMNRFKSIIFYTFFE